MTKAMHNCIPICKECCAAYPQLMQNVDCFKPGTCDEFKKILCRFCNAFTKRERIHYLAMRRRDLIANKFIKKCPCKFKKPVEIIRLYDNVEHTRLNQLALPRARHLLHLKQRVRNLFPYCRCDRLNRFIRQSLLSMYSRLQGARPPLPFVTKKKWTEDEWDLHTKKLKRLAKPKKEIQPPPIIRDTRPLKSRRFKKLARPVKHPLSKKKPWELTPGLKYYEPTERILQLARPKHFDTEHLVQAIPIPVSERALKYKASKRILELSEPRERRGSIGVAPGAESDIKENPFGVSPNALKAKCSERTEELAEPKEFENVHIRDNPNFISPAALKAKASPRIIELAEPRQR